MQQPVVTFELQVEGHYWREILGPDQYSTGSLCRFYLFCLYASDDFKLTVCINYALMYVIRQCFGSY